MNPAAANLPTVHLIGFDGEVLLSYFIQPTSQQVAEGCTSPQALADGLVRGLRDHFRAAEPAKEIAEVIITSPDSMTILGKVDLRPTRDAVEIRATIAGTKVTFTLVPDAASWDRLRDVCDDAPEAMARAVAAAICQSSPMQATAVKVANRG